MHPARRDFCALALTAICMAGCDSSSRSSGARITIAAASNLTGIFDEIAQAFRESTGIEVVVSYGSTAQIAKQIENGAPFDVFAAADAEHVDQLIAGGHLLADSKRIYARGQLALWIPRGEALNIHSLRDLAIPEIRFIALAQPDLAPYGRAAIEAIRNSGLEASLSTKLVYATSINMARQYAETGNADAALTAYSLVLKQPGTVLKVDPKLYTPIDQAIGVVSASKDQQSARQFVLFVTGKQGRELLRASGYEVR